MTANRTSGRSSKFTIPLVDDTGGTIDATSASWEMFDQRGVSIAAGVVADYEAGSATAVFTIAADKLTLPEGVPNAGREIVVFLTTPDDGEIEVRDYFVLVDAAPLKLMTNSLMTYPEALSMRQGFGPVLDGWDSVDDRVERQSALAQAFSNLCRIRYAVPLPEGVRHSDFAGYGTGTDLIFDARRRVTLTTLTLEDFDALSPQFQTAIRRAQLVEADVLLGGDMVGRKRRDGIISETIGESSTFFNSKPYLNLPISRQAFDEISRYVSISIGVARG